MSTSLYHHPTTQAIQRAMFSLSPSSSAPAARFALALRTHPLIGQLLWSLLAIFL